MKHQVNQLEGELLDLAVTKALGNEWHAPYSTKWQFGGPLVESKKIAIVASTGFGPRDGQVMWAAMVNTFSHYIDEPLPFNAYEGDAAAGQGPTPLIAAMRAYCASVFGEEVEL